MLTLEEFVFTRRSTPAVVQSRTRRLECSALRTPLRSMLCACVTPTGTRLGGDGREELGRVKAERRTVLGRNAERRRSICAQ